jgi:hypothetical protein
MKIKVDNVLIYKNSQDSMRYGTGVVTAITQDEYIILWSGRGLTRYKRSILDGKLEDVFEQVDKRAGLPKERHLQLGSSKVKVAFNENFDRAKVESLCAQLKLSGARKSKDIADSLTAEFLTKKPPLRRTAKSVLLQLAELCGARSSAHDEACSISKELFFGYVIQKSDFHEVEREK